MGITKETPYLKCRICDQWTRHTTKDGRGCCTVCYLKEDLKMTPNEYQKLALRTEKTPRLLLRQFIYFDENGKEDPHGVASEINCDMLLHGLMGMATETGENIDNLKKRLMYGKPFDRVNVLEECGDKLWYIAIALKAAGYTMDECMERNIEKLRKRFPDGFTEDKAINRNLDEERKALENANVSCSCVNGCKSPTCDKL